MKNYLPILQRCTLFEAIRPDELLTLLNCLGARVETYDKKYTIFAEGYPATQIGIVLTGGVQLLQLNAYDNRVLLANAEPGEMFAEAFACAGTQAMPVSVIATQPSDIMLLHCDRILHACQNHCDFHQQLIYNLLKSLAHKAVEFQQKIEITAKRTTRDKLMAYLVLQAKKANASSFTIPFDRQALADYLQVDRSGLSAEISKLRQAGVLECNKKHFTLLQHIR